MDQPQNKMLEEQINKAREYVKELQHNSSYTLEDLAEVTGLSSDSIKNFIYKKTQKVEFGIIALLVKALGGSLDELVGIPRPAQLPTDPTAQEKEIARLRQRIEDREQHHESDMERMVEARREAVDHLNGRIRFQNILIAALMGTIAVLLIVLVWFLWDALHSDWGRFQLREVAQLIPSSFLDLFRLKG